MTTHVFIYNKYDEPVNPPDPITAVDITKDVSPGSHYTGGGPVSYTITFENTSDFTIFDYVNFNDETSWIFNTDDVSNFEASIDGVFMTDDGGNIFGNPTTMTAFGGFEPGDVITITYDYDSSGLGTGTYTNTVTGCAWMGGIEYMNDVRFIDDIGPAISQPVCDTDDASFTVRNRIITRDDDRPAVLIEKTVNVDEASVGETVIYTITVTNNGEVSLTDVMVVDGLIGATWDIGNLGINESDTDDFDYVIQEGDFEDGEFVNFAEVTADSREGSVEGNDSATVDEIIINVPDDPTPPATTPETIETPFVPTPQALPQTGQFGPELFYGFGSLMLAAGYALRKKRRD